MVYGFGFGLRTSRNIKRSYIPLILKPIISSIRHVIFYLKAIAATAQGLTQHHPEYFLASFRGIVRLE
jgi:hypothetical protein